MRMRNGFGMRDVATHNVIPILFELPLKARIVLAGDLVLNTYGRLLQRRTEALQRALMR